MLRITLVLFIVGGASSQTKSSHYCPYLNKLHDFNVAQYMGKWYEFGTYNDIVETIVSKCVTAYYELSDHGSFNITDRAISWRTGTTSVTTVTAKPVGDSRYGKFTVRVLSGLDLKLIPYEVLETDYDNYALVRSCRNSTGLSVRVLTRARYPAAPIRIKVVDAMERNWLGDIVLISTDQDHCPKSY